MSSNLASETPDGRLAAPNAYESPRDYDLTNKGGEAPPGIARDNMIYVNGLVVKDNTRVQIGHTYVQNQCNGYSENYQRQSGPSNQRVDFVEALEFDYMDDRYRSIHIAHAATCRWLFHKLEYIRWRNSEYLDSHHGFLWIKGKPGSGKSTLMKHAFEDALENLQGDKVFSFFFSARGQHLEKSVEGMYRSLLLQLLLSFPELRSKLPMYSPGTVQRYGWDVPVLRNHFSGIINCLGRDESVTIYIDALDECDEDEIREALEHFEELSTSATSKRVRLYICFASRHYPQITLRRSLELSIERQSEHLQDIKTYIHNKMAVRDVECKAELATQIEGRSDGVFLWVVLVIKLLNGKSDKGETRSQLLHTLKEVPDKLKDLIAAILDPPDDVLVCTMKWILFALRPLTLEELYFAIRTGTGQVTTGVWDLIEVNRDGMQAFILESSRGLIDVKTGTKAVRKVRKSIMRVQLVHESVREYLLTGGLLTLGRCSDETVAAGIHFELSKWCQLYFSFDEKIHPLLSDHEELHGQSDYDDLESYPLLQYAASTAWEHLEIAYTAQA